MNIQKMIENGGREWRGGKKHRVYFNDLAGLYGLEIDRYRTGNISRAELHGEKISNSHARRLIGRLIGPLWYDVNHEKFSWHDLDDEDAEIIIAEIKRRCEP